MLRRGYQFEITKHLKELSTNEILVSFLKVLSTELKLDNIQSLLVNIFINIKHQLTDESLNKISQWIKANATSINPNTSKIKTSLSSCNLEQLPKDIFNNIGSYLSYRDTIHFSQLNHLFHSKIHNKSFFDCCIDCCNATLKLGESQMMKIIGRKTENIKNFGSLSYSEWKQLIISTDNEKTENTINVYFVD